MSSVLQVRETSRSDEGQVSALLAEDEAATIERWGNISVLQLVELSQLSLTVFDGDKVVGFASFSQICPETDPTRTTDRWLGFVVNKEICVANMIWLSCFIVDPIYEMEATEQVMRKVFATLPRVDFVLFLSSAEVSPFFLHDIFIPLKMAQGDPSGGTASMMSCHRDFYLSDMKVRIARVEDHDDLDPVFKKQVDRLESTYGEFFVADLVGSQDEENKALVAEVDGKAVGLLALSSDIDLTLLQQCFDLDSYNDFMQQKTVLVKEDPALRDPLLHLLNNDRLEELQNDIDADGTGTPLPKSDAEENEEEKDEESDEAKVVEVEMGVQWRALKQVVEAKFEDPDWSKVNVKALVTDLAKLLKQEQWLTEEAKAELAEAEETGLSATAGVIWSWNEIEEVLKRYAKRRALWHAWMYNRPKAKLRSKEILNALEADPDAKQFLPAAIALCSDDKFYQANDYSKEDCKKAMESILQPSLPGEENAMDPVAKEAVMKCIHEFSVEMRSASIRGILPIEKRGNFRVSVAGAPKAGSTTISKLLAAELALPCIRLMDVLEQSSNDLDDERSVELKQAIEAGEVPDSMASFWMKKRIEQDDCKRGYVLDNFPTSNSQRKAFEKVGIIVDKMIKLEVKDAMVLADHAAVKIAPDGDLSKWRMAFGNVEMAEEKRENGSRIVVSKLTSETTPIATLANILGSLDMWLDDPKAPPKTEVIEISNAFAITLFCLDDAFSARAADFLDDAFDLFPDMDYCIITMPPSAPESEMLKHFGRPKPRQKSTFSHVLYAMHKHALLGIHDITVVRLGSSESEMECAMKLILDDVTEMLNDDSTLTSEEMKQRKKELEEETRKRLELAKSLVGTPFHEYPSVVAFKAICAGQEVAAAIVDSRFTDSLSKTKKLCEKFCVQDIAQTQFHPFNAQATLVDYAVNPILKRQSRFILQEVMRQSLKTLLYYRSTPMSLRSSVTSEFIQVRPRLLAESNPSELLHEGNESSSETSNFSLHLISQNLLSKPKVVNNTRIIVVGASDTGISTLESLLLLPHIEFTNLKLISPGGLPRGESSVHAYGDNPNELLHGRSLYTSQELGQLGLGNKISVLPKKLVAIDRNAACVIVPSDDEESEDMVPYDVLLLTTGLQDDTDAQIGYNVELPEGVHFLTHRITSEFAAPAIDKAAAEKSNVVVFGASLRALQAIECLLRKNIDSKHITWVYSKFPTEIANSSVASQMVVSQLDKLGITRYEGLVVDRLVGDDNGKLVECVFVPIQNQSKSKSTPEELSLLLQSNETMPTSTLSANNGGGDSGSLVSISASFMFCASKPTVDADLYDAVSECGMVYDGRLVVDGDFKTVDDKIYAAGTVAKFSRRLRPQCTHERYNSKELGVKLAESLLERITNSNVISKRSLPEFEKPEVTQTLLPGQLYYSRVGVQVVKEPSRSMVTNPQEDGVVQFCKVVLDRHQRIAEILCITSMPVETRNLSRLIGLQESFVNSLIFSYENGKVKDFISFFRQPCCSALYHPSFSQFYRNLVDVTMSGESSVEALVDKLRELMKDENENGYEKLNELIGVGGSELSPQSYQVAKNALMRFLQENRGTLHSTYAISNGAEESKGK
eukprot:g4015.t1